MPGLVFSEEHLLNGNMFKFESRLQSHMNKYNEGGELLTTYFSQDENSSTVDRGFQDIDQLFGNKSPLVYIRILNFPLNQFTPATPENTEEQQLEDIGIEGDAVIFPSTIVPKQYDFFMVNHVKMDALFQITSVQYDMMKVEGYYKIHYRLHSTSREEIDKLMKQVRRTCYTDLNAIGSTRNPIIEEDDFIRRSKIEKIVNQMITSYRALFYNKRHNCFLYYDTKTRQNYFDMCGNEFIAKFSIMNYQNCPEVIVLHNKIRDPQFAYKYNNSVYSWIESGCPESFIQKFDYVCTSASGYPESSFCLWGDGDTQIIDPLPVQHVEPMNELFSIFDDTQLNVFLDKSHEPVTDFDLLIWRFINTQSSLSIQDIPLHIGDALVSSIKHRDIFLYTPIAIYIIRKILALN